MRVLQVLEAMGGGTKKHVGLLTRGLKARGVDVTIALPHRQPYEARNALMDYAFPEYMRSQGIQVEEFHMVHGRISPRRDLAAVQELVAFLLRERFDIVHAHSAKAGVLGRIAAHVAGVPGVIYTPYSLPFRTELGQGWRHWLYYAVEWGLAKCTDVIIATSPSEHAEIVQARIIPSKRISQITNCFDLEEYVWSMRHRMESRRRFGWTNDDVIVGTVARLSPQKDILTLVEAAPTIREQLPAVRFVIVGDGELRCEIQRRVNQLKLGESWTMLGKRDDYLHLMAGFDVFAFPSLWEGLPYAPIEAMALGVPIVATSVVGTKDLIRDGENGLLVPAGDGVALGTAIVRVLKNGALAKVLTEGGRRFVESKFRGELQIEQTLETYRKVLGCRQPEVSWTS